MASLVADSNCSSSKRKFCLLNWVFLHIWKMKNQHTYILQFLITSLAKSENDFYPNSIHSPSTRQSLFFFSFLSLFTIGKLFKKGGAYDYSHRIVCLIWLVFSVKRKKQKIMNFNFVSNLIVVRVRINLNWVGRIL